MSWVWSASAVKIDPRYLDQITFDRDIPSQIILDLDFCCSMFQQFVGLHGYIRREPVKF